jgi:uncharacterized protein YbjQ (UPF0145 family)
MNPPPLISSMNVPPRRRSVITGLSGNEMYCLQLKGLRPGELVIGNSVHSMGFLGGIGATLQGAFGGEVTQVTDIISEGRRASFQRMMIEAQQRGGVGITGVTSELTHFKGNIEFLSVASALHGATDAPEQLGFFNATRHLALQRIVGEAQSAGANAVLGIETRIMRFQGVHEMVMLGTAARHPALPPEFSRMPVTSDLTCEEMWNLASLGFAPLKLVLGTAVYSLGLIGGFKAMLKSFVRGEISDLTSLIYEAREHALGLIRAEADALGADDVVGIRTHIHELGSLIEFMAIGTAVKRLPGITTVSPTLPPQAIIKDKETWISGTDLMAIQATSSQEQ